MRRFGGFAATTIALTAVLVLIFGALLLPRTVVWLVDTLGGTGSTVAAGSRVDESDEARQRQIDTLWDFYREAKTLAEISDRERDVANAALEAISAGDTSSPGLYIQLKDAERIQNRAAARIREYPTLPQTRQARADLYAGFRARADAAGRFAEFLRSRRLDELWTGKLDQERGDGVVIGAIAAIEAHGQKLGIDLTTGQVIR